MRATLPYPLLADLVLGLHALAVAVVVLLAWLGHACPLTTLEMWLRAQAGLSTYSESFIGHWLQRLLYYDLPAWGFTVAYSLFGLLAVAIWTRFPTRKRPR